MSRTARFLQYAEDFENTYADNDWSRLRQYFTDDAVYESIGEEPFRARAEGLDALLGHLEGSVDAFDRRFDERTLELKGDIEERPGGVFLEWEATYRVADAPVLRLAGSEEAEFEGERIKRLTDRIEPEVTAAVGRWMEQNAAKLRGA